MLQRVPNCGRDLNGRAGDHVSVVIDEAFGQECDGFVRGERSVLQECACKRLFLANLCNSLFNLLFSVSLANCFSTEY